MARMVLNIEMPIEPDDIDKTKVCKLLNKFYKHVAKLDMSLAEVGAAIAMLQRDYYEEFDAIPMAGEVAEAIGNSRARLSKED